LASVGTLIYADSRKTIVRRELPQSKDADLIAA